MLDICFWLVFFVEETLVVVRDVKETLVAMKKKKVPFRKGESRYRLLRPSSDQAEGLSVNGD